MVTIVAITTPSTMGPRAAPYPRRWAPALLLVAACAPAPLTPGGARVALAHAPPPGCALVATLAGAAGYNGRSGETNAADVEIYLRNQAAERGGDALVITSQRRGADGDADTLSQPRGAAVSGGCPNCVAMTASAYRCPSTRGPQAGPDAGLLRSPVGASPRAAAVPAGAAAAEGDPPFVESAADAALAAAAESARQCWKKKEGAGEPAAPTATPREARVKVTFASTGDVVYSEVEDAPLAESAVGACVARKFRNARVPPFSGGARSLTRTVHGDE